MSQVEAHLSVLKLFNEKADKLLDSMFFKFIREKKEFAVKFSAKKGEAVRFETQLPDQHAVDEFVLNFRFFIQDNEKSSFRNMTRLYEKLPVSQNLKSEFLKLANNLNDFLDSEPDVKYRIFKEPLTRRNIMEVFIWGNIAHANQTKKQIFDEWKRDSIVFPMLEFSFSSILEAILRAIRYAKEINERAIDEMRRTV